LQGVILMDRLPDIVVVIGQAKELNAVRECLKLGVCLITLLDTNCDPTLTDFLIPANDDSISSVALILKSISQSLTSIID
jgi:small subunit ribosomal protein S2